MSSSPFAPLVRLVNAAVSALAKAPVVGRFVSRGITEITYVGRWTGRTFRTPVGYRRSGDDVLIGVEFPDAKTWWRNFLGDGGPLTLTLDGTDRTGHAVTTRDDQGRVSVRVRLDA